MSANKPIKSSDGQFAKQTASLPCSWAKSIKYNAFSRTALIFWTLRMILLSLTKRLKLVPFGLDHLLNKPSLKNPLSNFSQPLIVQYFFQLCCSFNHWQQAFWCSLNTLFSTASAQISSKAIKCAVSALIFDKRG